MDTKLKKSSKLAKVIITLFILIPAVVMVSLYPTISSAMDKKEKEYEEVFLDEEESYYVDLDMRFVNYAMEFSYYAYGQSLEKSGESVDYSVLEEYGWIDDYWEVYDRIPYHTSYNVDTGLVEDSNTETLTDDDTYALLTLEFDSNGYLKTANLETLKEDTNVYFAYTTGADSIRMAANDSIMQYENNVHAFIDNTGKIIAEDQLCPKNFTAQFAIEEGNPWILSSEIVDNNYISTESLLFEVGVLWIILVDVILVALVAFLLPFIKGLQTGWEKLFSMPLEIVVCIVGGDIAGFVGMFYAIGEMCRYTPNVQGLEVIGYAVSDSLQYDVLMILNFLGWAACFFAEYVAIASLRQFIAAPKYYLKNRILCVRLLRWLKRKCVKVGKKVYNYVTDIDIHDKLQSSILKVVLVNFVVVALLCCIWFGGIVGAIVYSVVLYLLIRKQGEKLKKQYDSILHATEQMADGDLKIILDEDLGIFTPIGESLEKVQQGFEKAVVEEAKSQNMKTELITNVSHDLKTPLTAIITYIDLLKREDITEEERKSYIRTLEQKSQRLKVLIEDLFEVSKANSGNVTMNFMDVDVVSLLKQVRSEMDEQIKDSDLQFRWNLPDEKVILSLDGQRTYRVFENLLNNILKYAMPHSRVYVDLVSSETQIEVRFRNISAMELDFDAQRLTERFVRGDSSRNSEGSGLGLAIAKSFVELQNGNFEVEVDGDLFKVIITFSK